MLSPALNPARQLQQQQQGLAGLPSLPQVQPGLQQLPPQLLHQQQLPQQQPLPPGAVGDGAGVLAVDGQLQQQLPQLPQQAAH